MQKLVKSCVCTAFFLFSLLTFSHATIAAESISVKQVLSGAASWYGPRFHGRTTANGERYDMDGLTAAHRSLPFGTKVRVTNLTNGQSVTVRINDRGPFVEGRCLDLARGAFEEIASLGAGVITVRYQVL